MIQLNLYWLGGSDKKIPDGKTAVPINDVQIWLNCANIWNKTYTTIGEVLADTDTLAAVIADDNAADYLLRSTSFTTICTDANAMNYIGASNYASDILLDDLTWATAIGNSIYFESVLNAKVPPMTSDSTPSGTCAASSTSSGFAAYRAFISDFTDNGWAPASGSSFGSSWVSYEFTTPIKVKKVKARYVRISAGYTLTFKIQGYNTSTNAWEDLTSGLTAYENTTVNNVISSDNSKNEHRKYRALLVSGSPAAYNVPDTGNGYHFQFYGRKDV